MSSAGASGLVLVVGATGRVGSELTRLLTTGGKPVRALVRDERRSATLAALGAEVAVGDLALPETLDDAVRGVDSVFLASSDDPAQHELQLNLVQAAIRGGAHKIVKLSASSAFPSTPVVLSRWHVETEQVIEQSGLAYTHLRPYFFMQSFLAFAEPIRHEDTLFAPVPSGRLAAVDARDVAAVAAHALAVSGDSTAYAVSGPEALSFDDVAALLTEALGRTIEFVPVPSVDARAQMLAAGLPPWLAESLVALYALIEDGFQEPVLPLPDGMTLERRTLRGFIDEHRSQLAKR